MLVVDCTVDMEYSINNHLFIILIIISMNKRQRGGGYDNAVVIVMCFLYLSLIRHYSVH